MTGEAGLRRDNERLKASLLGCQEQVNRDAAELERVRADLRERSQHAGDSDAEAAGALERLRADKALLTERVLELELELDRVTADKATFEGWYANAIAEVTRLRDENDQLRTRLEALGQ